MLQVIKELRSINNEEACNWIMKKYPVDSANFSLVFKIIPHISWSRKVRRKLANYYLSIQPFATEYPYLCFLKVMPLKELLSIIAENLPKDFNKLELVKYHLQTLLKSDDICIANKKELLEFIKKLDTMA